MKYTVIIDTGLGDNQTKSEVREELSRQFKVDYIESGDQTNREFFSVTRWSDEDVREALERRDITVNQENIELVKERSDTLEGQSIETGWEVLDVIISDIDYDKYFNNGEDNE